MVKQIITAPNECNYLSEFMTELPVNCLFDKGKTACGGTSTAIENAKDTIIAMPYVNVIKNKVAQYPNDRCKHELLGIYEGITDKDILDYINTHEIKKIAVTYDSLERLITTLLEKGIDVYNDYYCLIDEWHILFNSYAFRNNAVKKVLQYSKKFKEVTYMTATPIEEEFILKELRGLPVIEVQWSNVATVNVQPIVSNQPLKTVCNLVKNAIAGTMFGNLHFFVNSVEFIADAIKHTGLQPSQVRVICSDNKNTGKGVKSNQSKLGNNYPIENTTSNVKKVNFYTSTCFEGCDIYDQNGKTYIVSDKRKSHTLLDISTLFIQICGRIRDSQYNTKVGHVFSETRYSKDVTFEEFKKSQEEQKRKANLLVNSINAMPEEARIMDIALHEKNNKAGLNGMYIYNNNGFLELEENLINLDTVNFKITKHLYQCRVNLAYEYGKNGFNVLPEKERIYTDLLVSNPQAKISFKDLFDEYVSLRNQVFYHYPVGNKFERIRLIEREKPVIKEAYEKLGTDRVKEMKYSVGNIKRAILNMQTDISTDAKIVRCLKDAGVTAGTTTPAKSLKNLLQGIYKSFDIKNSYGKIKAAKATDLSNWFEIKKSSPKINGKTTDCITIINEKIIFV
ncbi:MAG: hypothetical protein LBE91_08460 [Tannerella sp.]|jgi:hypothetical protein|nr:hypothetical protein [Tannerella sp.]